MNSSRPLLPSLKHVFRIWLKLRRFLPKEKCRAFGASSAERCPGIEKIYVINLDRQPDRWAEIERELRRVVDSSGVDLADLTERCSAVDAARIAEIPPDGTDVNPFYTLEDQLFVEPQPCALPDRLQLDRPIRMTLQEIAVARSHISLWRRIAAGKQNHCLVLEDDIWLQHGFARYLEQAWQELIAQDPRTGLFDVLYLSYKEVRHGAQKALLSDSIFCPVRGLWYLSGYVLSREGAKKLLRRLPCRGPVDLWINHQFQALSVRATRRSIIAQRLDGDSTNSYSILPVLGRIGAIDSEGASLFQIRPTERPVFAFGPEKSGLSSLAMALSMLGYRCCSDLSKLPEGEYQKVLSGRGDCIFDAYVNIGSLTKRIRQLSQRHPSAKFIVTTRRGAAADVTSIDGMDYLTGSLAVLSADEANKWRVLCEHLNCAPPVCSFPKIEDLGQRRLLDVRPHSDGVATKKVPRRDRSPWVIEASRSWKGIHTVPVTWAHSSDGTCVSFRDFLEGPAPKRWFLRDDTFTGNLGLFRPSNVEFRAGGGAGLHVRKEALGVRDYSAASICSCSQYLYGKFEAVVQPTNAPGLVTGFFLQRDSPRQEIDIEIAGNRPDILVANVFYNPGDEGARYDYGYRGAPTKIPLGFDASRSAHVFTIEWEPNEIRWLVDNRLVHRRVNWDPTPIPHLVMRLNVNTWPSRSKELAGRVSVRLLPATTVVESIAVDAIFLQTGAPEPTDDLLRCSCTESNDMQQKREVARVLG
jgi:GR25 family glycosyltransferase involved in LPS biosynthesis